VIPTVFSILPAPKAVHVKHLENKLIYRLLRVFEHLVSERRKAVFISTGILIIAAGIGLTRLEAVGFILDDIPKEDKLYTDLLFFQEHFKGVMPLAVLIDTGKKGGAQKISNLRKIERAEAIFEEHDFFSKPVSVVSLMKAANQAYYNGNPKHYRLPNNQESRFVVPYAVRTANREAGVNMTLTDSARQVVRIALNMADVGTKVMKATFEAIRPKVDSIFAGDENVSVTYTGKSPVFLKGNQYLIDSLIFSLVLAFILISFIMAALFKSMRIIFISFATNAIPLLITAAAMGYLGIYLKPSTVLIFSIAFGISVDDSIHFLTKYRQELKWHSWDMKKTVLTALDETGTSMIYTSVILFFGFIIFAASNFQGTVALGMLTSVTLIVAMLANLVLLPSLIIELDSRSKKQIGHRLR
jgi:predicted RND superfamily exporter protein